MKILDNKTITDVPNIKAAGIPCGIRKSGKKDLCLIYSEVRAVAAAVFTTNKIKGAPLLVCMENIKSDNTQAIIVNSGNANACTGEEGINNAKIMAQRVADTLGLNFEEVMVQSTGVIGEQLPMDNILTGINIAADKLSYSGGVDAAQAILTTDTCTKTIAVEVEIDGKPVIISGMAKGSGMIHPNMATMLSYVITNANISKNMLDSVLKESVNNTYNMISVDGDTSTNDMVIALANASAENKIIDTKNQDYEKFKEAFNFVNTELAKMIAKDGEGATKLLEVKVNNAKTLEDAKKAAMAIISSNLTKCAIFGSDANWGRIMCALGYANVNFDAERVDIFFESEAGIIQVVKTGWGLKFDEDDAKKILLKDYIKVIVDLNNGNENAVAWGCDLTYDYVRINGSYRT
jgi:glutamate N-acetyltransferase / amino-acid N-acetyltransferase